MRRRRFRKKPEVVRRERPLLIECFGAPGNTSPAAPVTVPIGSERYVFQPDGRGRKVAHVDIEDHIACFLARAEMYRAVS